MLTSRTALVAMSGLLAAGCPGPSATDAGTTPVDNGPVTTSILPVSPTGTVTGQILDRFTQRPLEGATVTLLVEAGEVTATTGATGTFTIPDVPASNQLGLAVEAQGYASAWSTVDVPGEAGNLAQENGVGFAGPIELLPLAPGLAPRYQPVDADGMPLMGFTLSSSLGVRFVDDGVAKGQITGMATADGTAWTIADLPHLAALATSLPTARLTTVIVPDDPSLAPTVSELSVVQALAEGTVEVVVAPVVDPPDPEPEPVIDAGPEPDLWEDDTPLRVVGGNVADLVDPMALGITGARPQAISTLGLMDAIELVTSRPIDEASLFVTAIDDTGAALVVGAPTFTASDELGQSRVSIAPPTGGWPAGSEVNLVVEALLPGGTGPGSPLARTGSFVTAPAAPLALLTTASLVDVTGALTCPTGGTPPTEIQLTLNGPVGHRDVDGQPALAQGDVLAVRAVSVSLGVAMNSPLHVDYEGNSPGAAVIIEDDGFAPSGYGRHVRIPWTNGMLNNAFFPVQALSEQLQVTLRFNDVATTYETGTFGDGVLRQAGGGAVPTLSATVDLSASLAGITPCTP